MDDKVKDFLTFRKMITPIFIQIIFWIAVAVTIIYGFYILFNGAAGQGILTILLGPIAVRIWTELLIVIFKINDTLTDIKNNTKKVA
jgi:hypothetical protein